MSPETLNKSIVSHNTRDVKYTDPLRTVALSDADVRRFWSKVEKRAPGDCWPWTASKLSRTGYGQFTAVEPGAVARQRHLYAHRVAWTLSHGPIPEGQSVLHSCDVPPCVNPAHLFLGTQRTNMEDAARKERLRVPRPSARKLPEPKREDVRQRYAAGGITLQALADEHSVTRGYIWQIVHKRSVEFRRKRAS